MDMRTFGLEAAIVVAVVEQVEWLGAAPDWSQRVRHVIPPSITLRVSAQQFSLHSSHVKLRSMSISDCGRAEAAGESYLRASQCLCAGLLGLRTGDATDRWFRTSFQFRRRLFGDPLKVLRSML